MKTKSSPVRTTIVYGALCAVAFYAISLLSPFVILNFAHPLSGWLLIAGYGYFLAKWEGKPKGRLLFPLSLSLLATMALPPSTSFVLLPVHLLTLSWIRSDILFGDRGLRSLILESLLSFGGAISAAALTTNTLGGTAIAIWIFFLVQSLYFPLRSSETEMKTATPPDTFEQAERRVERILAS